MNTDIDTISRRRHGPAHKLSPALAPLVLGCLMSAVAAPASTDSSLQLTLRPVDQSVALSWFASNAVAYQVEASVTLSAWTNAGPVLTGAGALLSVTNPLAGEPCFFRVKRLVDVITAAFSPATGTLNIFGDKLPNRIVVSRDAAGVIHVNDGAVSVTGGTPSVANTVVIQVFARAGDDYAALDEANGALPRAQLFGEAGNDTLIGGSGADTLDGGAGNDTLLGRDGADNLSGGDDDDIITGGEGDDIVQLGGGNDRLTWNPGDDSDVIDGGDGADTVEVNGGNGAEFFTATANGTRVRFDRVEPAPFFLDLGTCESLLVHCHGGDDRFAATGNLAALIGLTIDGGPGRDTLLGGNGPDLLRGGDDNDFIDGNQGGDVILLGAGDDTFQWDPGDGSDTVEGQAGQDTLSFNGSNIGEIFDFSANVARLRLTRNVGNIVMDGDGLEQVRLNTLGGADFINIHDLTGTSVADVSLSLASPLGSNTGDGSADNVIVKGTSDDDSVTVAGDTNSILVLGLHAVVTIAGHEAARDLLSMHTLAGEDLVDASTLAAGAIGFAADGGDHDDVLIGSAGVDVLFGGEGDDVLLGGPGADALDGGPGNNVVIQD